MVIPKEIFGVCNVCGGAGGDAPSNASHRTSADAAPTDTTGNGEKLYEYRGNKMCQSCLNDEKAREESRRIRDKDNCSQEFRGKAGFTSSVS